MKRLTNPCFATILMVGILWFSNRFNPLLAQKIPTQKRPNIIFLLTDDHRWDALGAMGNSIIKTPNLDALANKGILFKNAYVTTAICCVSRASILRGQYESRHGINDFTTPFTPEALAKTYPLLLKKAGYTIGFIGKYGVGEGKDHPSQFYDYWSCGKEGQPPYEFINASGQLVHHTDSVQHDIQKFLETYGSKSPSRPGPFCLSVSFKAPHELDGNPPTYPVQARYKNLYSDVTIPEPVTASPIYWERFPAFFKTDQNIARDRWKPLFSTSERRQETVRNYYRLITGVDEVVGKLVAQLKSLNLDKNTVIVFMGDNGFYLGEHGLEGKWYGHEESIRVPLLVYGSSLPATLKGSRPTQMALNIDIAPTILALAGVATPPDMQGVDLIKLAQKKVAARPDFFYEHTFMGSPRLPKVEGVVTPTFKYMNFIEHEYEELYDTAHDPHETTNLAYNPAYASKKAALKKRYTALKQTVR
ncbi:sulfatase family protein [Spirosoma foliorum]|uniref:Sulfatase n=1 Tax=Spirosoma foliorum TaxID=2710596 RepID=A0A7G5H619_9BACT|nr:sulfatase [Spirosoma foliorum]QMW06561.1 sulfatase [Spirosoma foliorum]